MRGEQVIVERDALSVVLNHADPSPWEKISSQERLQSVNISRNSGVSASRWSSLGARLESLERLKTLRLSWCELYDEKVEMFFPSLPVTLEELHLQANNKISSVGWASLGTRLKSLEQLKKLDLYSCGLEAAKVQSLFPSLPTSLEHLNLSGCGLQDGTSQLLFPSLPVTLEDLDLQGE
uniref:Uncharacterized protein n=1 Tax=Chromera velia CCMP2878 TaxID=1169474 RepID=A0A0G4FTC1_9ALVE|eukprot:Cvel_3730.t1-p1 / transcript=Cvel_3730.t1 / gene=Cvel_3730 / organism=Chromera_velia_CCMP2878 / gene_product=hypothetical protein / transcript_product=hypothetical protein / location=Cvel_scaffold155:47256-52520(+) / protein_length=178 / sequence_SO=supercontig / SO=protein_coding / is_pseudo=false